MLVCRSCKVSEGEGREVGMGVGLQALQSEPGEREGGREVGKSVGLQVLQSQQGEGREIGRGVGLQALHRALGGRAGVRERQQEGGVLDRLMIHKNLQVLLGSDVSTFLRQTLGANADADRGAGYKPRRGRNSRTRIRTVT